MNTHNIPLSVWLLGIPGLICIVAGIVLLAGDFQRIHPLLGGAGAGLAAFVSGIALIGSAGFPLALSRLAARDEAAQARLRD